MLIWGGNGLFLFDSHIRNVEGFPDPNVSAVLLEFRLIRSLNIFIKRFYQVNVPNLFYFQYEIQNITVNVSTENICNILTVLNLQKNSNYYYQSKNRNTDVDFEIDSHSRNVEGFPDANGSAVLLEFRLISSLNNFIKRFYQVNVPSSFLLQYDIQY